MAQSAASQIKACSLNSHSLLSMSLVAQWCLDDVRPIGLFEERCFVWITTGAWGMGHSFLGSTCCCIQVWSLFLLWVSLHLTSCLVLLLFHSGSSSISGFCLLTVFLDLPLDYCSRLTSATTLVRLILFISHLWTSLLPIWDYARDFELKIQVQWSPHLLM